MPTGGVRLPSTDEEWHATWQVASNPYLARVVREYGPRLLGLACDLVWATAWMGDANDVIAPLLGLPALPVVDFEGLPGVDDPVYGEADASAPVNWKTRKIVELAAGRTFVWVDDEITDVDRGFVAGHHRGRALLHRVDSAIGITEADFVVVERWLRG